jgi:hypothetical protein
MSGRTPNDVAAFTHKVPDFWRPEVDGRGNVHIPGARCAANVGKSALGGWVLLDQWGSTWAVGFATRRDACRLAYALQLEADAHRCANCGKPIRRTAIEGGDVWDHWTEGHHTVCDWTPDMDPTDRVATPVGAMR